MIFVPLPFVVALLLAILLIRMLRQGDGSFAEKRPFLLLIGFYIIQSVVIGIRWGYDIIDIMPLQSLMATMIAALAWVCFKGLAMEEQPTLSRFWPHLLPAAAIVIFIALYPEPISLAIILIFIAYGIALLWLARRGPDALVASRLDGAVLSYRSLQITGFALIASAVTDIVISFDFTQAGGIHAGAIVALGNVIALLILGTAASVAGNGSTMDAASSEPPPPPPATEEDGAVAAALDALMHARQLYRDPDLNLSRIARKMNLPARRVSMAVNRIHGMSVSQYVNDLRIRSACEQLVTTDHPVTQVMFDSGFISKSNFNREFARLNGESPTQFRKRRVPRESGGAASNVIFMSP
ncbi:helix-turn-helix domain-containing protein [Rhizobium sp. BK418]|uniref:helix-turn-helix domain-containing protein n=1 Tax=Rhizobium sp. BK418 TaxID=2512120 RepID=UPI001052B4F0|nr:helix-turn-helix domain-containing protein [Rhizobium sp. BK418]TCS00720.1 AraC family transcriptional regulator [Rhizobium sp. BK418]